MPRLDKATTADLVRLVIFGVITTLLTGLLVMTIGNMSFGTATVSYRAQFSDVTGVLEGDDVRIAGVKVGSVEKIEIIEGNRARLTFSVEEDKALGTETKARIRYRNLIGQRYLALTETAGGEEMQEGAEIPISRTEPALDLTVLFNGFKPLFEALSPDDINRLSYEIVQVFQGEGGTVESLLASTASVTQTIANRDALIGELLENLDYALDFVADREQELTATIKSFRTLVSGLKQDRGAILDSLDGISELSVETAGLLQGLRAPLVRDIKELRTLATNLDRDKAEIDRALQVLPIKLTKIGRTATYGSFFNFYLCNFSAEIKLGPERQLADVKYQTYDGSSDHRCELP